MGPDGNAPEIRAPRTPVGWDGRSLDPRRPASRKSNAILQPWSCICCLCLQLLSCRQFQGGKPMTTTQLSPGRTRVVLIELFAGAFVMGCAEMLVVGMLDLITVDLAVSVPAAGALVTANALGLAIGGPLLTFLTTRLRSPTGVDHGHRRVRADQPAARARRGLSDLPSRPGRRRRGAGFVHRGRDRHGHLDREAGAVRPGDGDRHLRLCDLECVGSAIGHAARSGRRLARFVRSRRGHRRRRPGGRSRGAAPGTDLRESRLSGRPRTPSLRGCSPCWGWVC